MGGPKNVVNEPVQEYTQCSECDGKENEICTKFIPDNLNNLICGICGHKKISHIIYKKTNNSTPNPIISTAIAKAAAAKVIGGRLPYKSRTKRRTQRRHKKHTQRRHKKN